MAKDLKHIPELRFPEFKNSGEWNKIALEDILDYEQPTKYIVESDNYKEEGTPVLTANKSIILGYTKELHNIYETLPTIIFDDFTADSKYIDFPFKIKSSAIKLLTVKCEREDDLRFIFETIQLIPFEAKEHKRHYISEFQKQYIYIPQNPAEQKKIADCLSSLDNYINATQEKIELLQSYKKGLMQHLFPILGENMPKLRFPKFKKSKGWKIVKLKTICHITNGKANTQDHHKNGKYPLFDRSAITKASDEYIFDAEAVIIPGEGVRFIPKYYNGKFNLHQRAYALKDFTCNALFVYYIMQQKESLLAQKAVQSTVLSLRLPILQEFPIELPTDIDEQKEIAECLASIDDLIDKTKQKLVMLQNHKRGLMQQLFPAV